MKVALTIAGSDSCGGAGIQADLKTFGALGVYGMSVITAVTAQNSKAVLGVREMDAAFVREQIDCLFEDIRIDAVKIGMVSNIEIIDVIGECLKKNRAANIVVDPVMVSKSGYPLLRPEAVNELIKVLFPLAEVVTPNLAEAELITGDKIENTGQMERAAVKIYRLGGAKVIVKGGHLTEGAADVYYDGREFRHFKGTRIENKNTHGTGCTFSSAIAAFLARGCPLDQAVGRAKEYVSGAIRNSLKLGGGTDLINHFYHLGQVP
ncbi:MAG: bifunctional hydroxymethylpyrimidine kinase/phosphomethylpyrimidine kinase [Pelotomaculum sp.]|uniref:Hydroxymethylpyrimidine/phosphomethylpyrimidine kinase n=1 Tax=Pelotomaculum thermopropionicum (strain DSM 13744 / JCM 10971 / SI) TaxID=370438 RepID=A5D3T3_PELTS|nr:bifunctional hydroxymethylpyrimidine kinase/phosphomethylpyrimidine kinase [Pelotomaculum sp.]BAF59106.1 hydroxymethylpyrimidine/phosphomethylpyrimidine kinase [Pelotomaculum thermopropionicum SI]